MKMREGGPIGQAADSVGSTPATPSPLLVAADEAQLSPAVRDDVTAFYVWHTLAKRKRATGKRRHRRLRCVVCGAHRPNVNVRREPGKCRACQNPKNRGRPPGIPNREGRLNPELIALALIQHGHLQTYDACFGRPHATAADRNRGRTAHGVTVGPV